MQKVPDDSLQEKGVDAAKAGSPRQLFFFSYVVCGSVLYNLKETPTAGITERWHRSNGSSHLSFRGKNRVITFHQRMRKLTFKIPASIPLHLGNHTPGIPSKSPSGKKLWLYLITHLKSLCCWKVSWGSLGWGKVDLGGTILIQDLRDETCMVWSRSFLEFCQCSRPVQKVNWAIHTGTWHECRLAAS